MEIDRHHIISASAGTGKTFLIENRIVELLVGGHATIDQLLVVTFTEKATAELRFRVRAKIESLLALNHDDSNTIDSTCTWVIDAPVRRRLEEAIIGFDRAAIFTIHGFCQRIASENGFIRGRTLSPTQVAGRAVFAETFAELMRTEFTLNLGAKILLEAWFRDGRTATQLQDLLWNCRERGGIVEPILDRNALHAAVQDVYQYISTPHPIKGIKLHAGTQKAIRSRLEKVGKPLERAAKAEVAERAILELTTVAKELAELAEKSTTIDLPIFSAFAQLEKVRLDVDAAIVSALLPRIEEQLTDRKRRRGELDFTDMLVHVAEALAGNHGPSLANELANRYPLALIDEFQDTSELQWDIFRSIYLKSSAKARLTVVGDIKQAIYSFRGADLHTYQQALDELANHGAPTHVLSTNYRSTPQLIEALNCIIAGEIGDPFFSKKISYSKVCAGRQFTLEDASGELLAPVIVDVIGNDKNLRASELNQRISQAFAKEIEKVLGPSPLYLAEPVSKPGADAAKYGEKRKRLSAADIMILTRSRKESLLIADALNNRGIANSMLTNEDLFTTDEAHELLDLLRAIAALSLPSRRSRGVIAAALATQFFDLSLDSLVTAAHDPDKIEAVAMLHRWRIRCERAGVEALLTSLVGDCRLGSRELATARGLRTVTNIEHLIEILIADVVRSRCTLAELTDRLETWIVAASNSENLEATRIRIGGDSEAVQILTVHAAKGLEAALVFVFGGYTHRSISSERVHTYHDDHSQRRLRVGRVPSEMTGRIEHERDAEDERLMYVAITRAAARLHVCYIDPPVYKVGGFYSIINRRLTPMCTFDNQLFERRTNQSTDTDTNTAKPRQRYPALRLVRAHDASAKNSATEFTKTISLESLNAPQGPATRAPAANSPAIKSIGPDALTTQSEYTEPTIPEHIERIRDLRGRIPMTSYSQIHRGASSDSMGEKFGNDELGIDGSIGDLGGREVGILAHWILEHLPLAPVRGLSELDEFIAIDEVANLIDRAMRAFALDDKHRSVIEQLAFSGLICPWNIDGQTVGSLASSIHCAREVEFTFPLYPNSNQHGYVTGILDVLAESNGRLYVIDWKSDALSNYSAEAIRGHVDANYSIQSELYSLALAQMAQSLDPNDPRRLFGGVIYCFLRGQAATGHRANLDELAHYRNTLAESEGR